MSNYQSSFRVIDLKLDVEPSLVQLLVYFYDVNS